MHLIRGFLFILCLSGCASNPPHLPTEFADNRMTIDYRILVGDPLTSRQIQQIHLLIQSVFEEINETYNKWNPNSELTKINNLPAGTIHSLSPQLYRFLQQIDVYVALSEGRFDPTIEPLQQLWKVQLEQGNLPDQSELDKLKPCIGWHTIHYSNGQFYKDDSRTKLDLGGIAKGLCVDLLIERLQTAGFNNLYVEWGGEIRTVGQHPAQRPWRVYISKLGNPDPAQAIAELNLTNQALATSGDYFQYWTIVDTLGEKKTYCHIFNPLTLSPVEVKTNSIATASLLAPDCVTADALAKVLMLFATKEEAEAWFKKIQLTDLSLACWIVTR